MLIRIKRIHQIGRFKNFNGGGAVELGNATNGKKICAIYGDNTYGKSTITDILRSANDNDSSLIISRQSIPHLSDVSQTVDLTYKVPTSNNEVNITYENNGWTNNLLVGKLLLEII